MSGLEVFRSWPEGLRALLAVDAALAESDLEASLLELVRTRVSQLNGCAFCLDMHGREAVAAGEDPLRLVRLPAWRESPDYLGRERAALALAEAVTRCEGSVGDAVIDDARRHLTARETVQLVYAVAVMNAWDLPIADRTPPGAVRPRS